MERIVKTGLGWRIGWQATAKKYQGLLGNDDWAVELTATELNDFCRLLEQLSQTMSDVAGELMPEEKIAIEAETDLIWLQIDGYVNNYSLSFLLKGDRACEGYWQAKAVPSLILAALSLKLF